MNNLTRLHPSKRDHYRVTIFGSARIESGTFAYEEVKRLARALTEMGCDVVTGGGPGLMLAANEGAASAGYKECIHWNPGESSFRAGSESIRTANL